VVSNHGSLAEAPGFYDAFDRRADGIVKVVLNP
jgi:threonine dehydrogenase-like Zn-dependent dehydrogenase